LRDFRGTVLCDLDRESSAALGALFDGIDIRSDPAAFKWLRMVKTKVELDRLKAAAKVTETAIEAVASACEEGVAQETLTRTFCSSLAGSGAQLRLVHISMSRSGSFGNANVPGDRLSAGDVVKLDVGAVVGGYASDMSRCFSLGTPSEKARDYYAALVAGQEAAFQSLRPGIRACEVFDHADDAVRANGIPHYERTNVGHGIGVDGDGYDPPLLGPTDETMLEAGMVLCVETPYYEIGFGGLQVEDMVLVTNDGFEPLTRSTRQMWSVG
jgi:Xaa-Pro aminopeptidase